MNTQSREINSIRNLIVGIINQIFLLFLNLVAKLVFIKTLGTVFLGINGLLTNIFFLLSFAQFGIGSVMVYSLYNPIAKEDKNTVISIYKFFQKIYSIMSGIILIIGLTIIPMLDFIVNTEATVNNIRLYYFLFLLSIIISNLYMYKSHLVIANQKKYLISLYQFFFDAIALILQITLLLYAPNYILYLIIILAKNILLSFSITRKVNKLYPFLKERVTYYKIEINEKQRILKKIKDVFSYNFANAMLTATDNIIISIVVGTVWVGYYANYDLIIMGVLSLVYTFYSGISASIGNLIAKDKVENQYKVFKITQMMSCWIAGFTTTCLYILFQDFITLWIGKEFLLDCKVEAVIIFNYYLICTKNSIKVFREASGIFEKVKYIMSIAAVINVVLSILMGMIWGIFGILLASSITAVSTYYWYEAKLLMEIQFGCSLSTYLKSQIKSFLLTITSIAITSLCVINIHGVTINNFIIKIGICLLVPNLFYFIILKKENEFKEIIMVIVRNYKKLIQRRKNE